MIPHKNRDGDWIVYHARLGTVMELPGAKAHELLLAGRVVVAPGAKPADYKPEPAGSEPEAPTPRKPKSRGKKK